MLVLVSPSMLTKGMFTDGLIYTDIAKNIAEGQCSFWNLQETTTQFPQFFEHPPLMMNMLACWMSVFGTTILSAKAYALLMIVIAATLIIALWHAVGHEYRTAWLPLLLWLMIPPATHFAFFNMLECTMLVFVLAAVLCMLQRDGNSVWWHMGGGLLLSAAFLTKGFSGLFPLALPALHWLTHRKQQSVGRALLLTAITLLATILPILIIVILNPEAKHYLYTYLTHQVIGGSHVYLHNRWYIVGRFFVHTALVWLATAVVVSITALQHRSKPSLKTFVAKHRTALMLLALAFLGVIPMMVSTKQRDFYLLTAYPVLAFSVALIIDKEMHNQLQGLASNSILAVFALLLLGTGVGINMANYGKAGRDNALLNDMELILPHLQKGETVGITASMQGEYSLHSYYHIYGGITLDSQCSGSHLLTDGCTLNAEMAEQYEELCLGTQKYKLYKRKQ